MKMIETIFKNIYIYKDSRIIPSLNDFNKKSKEIEDLLHKYTMLVWEASDISDLKKQTGEMRKYAVVYERIIKEICDLCAMSNISRIF